MSFAPTQLKHEEIPEKREFSPPNPLENSLSAQGQGGRSMELEYDASNREKIMDFDRKLEKLLSFSERDEDLLLGLERESQESARTLQNKEENKVRAVVNLLIDIQLSKLEAKLTYLEEFEKLIWYEKTELEVLQRMNIAERVNLAFKKNELSKQLSQNSHFGPHTAEKSKGNEEIGQEKTGKNEKFEEDSREIEQNLDDGGEREQDEGKVEDFGEEIEGN